jgi:hypothetical protein
MADARFTILCGCGIPPWIPAISALQSAWNRELTGRPAIAGSLPPVRFWKAAAISYWGARFPDEDESSLAAGLEKRVARLRNYKHFLDEFHSSGGSAEFFIGWFVDRNSGDELHWSLLRELADMHISLSFDVYGSEIGNTPKL